MKFKDIVNIKESFCCNSCTSYEYDLPCQIDAQLLKNIFEIMDNLKHNMGFDDILKSNLPFQIIKSENTKIELKPNSRYLKLCADNKDFSFKLKIDELLVKWIEDKLNIEIEL